MKKNNVLIFDFDGTIADTFQALIKISNLLATEFNFKEIAPEEVETLKNFSIKEVVKHLNIPFLKIPILVARAKDELHKQIELMKPAKDLKEILCQLKILNCSMGIVSSNSLKNVSEFLENQELNIFDFIHSTSKIWSKNRILKHLIEKHELDIEDVIYIGDEIRDIKAAKKAGIRSAAVTWGYNSKEILSTHNPDYVINSPKELLQFMNLKVQIGRNQD